MKRPEARGKKITTTSILVGALLVFQCFMIRCCWAEDAKPLALVVHAHTGVSDGTWTPAQVLREAHARGADAVLFGDSLLERWEYGLPPLRHIIRRVVNHSSVLQWGAAGYLRQIREAARENPSVLALPGVSAAPYYHWSAMPQLQRGALESWHRQLLVWGVQDAAVLTEFPAVSNDRASWRTVARQPRRVWPLLLALAGLAGWWMRHRRGYAAGAWASCALLGGVLLWNANVCATSPYTPYHRDPGARPYQEAIDYVTRHGGVVFWSHPALQSSAAYLGIPVETAPYTDLLFETRGYTGFGMNYSGYLAFLKPGDGWDQLLRSFCAGTRAQPAWLIGEAGFHEPSRSLTMVETFAYATARTEAAILEALRTGRMYAQFNLDDGPDVELTQYVVRDTASARTAGMGQTLQSDGPCALVLAGRQRPGGDTPTTVTIVRDGAAVHVVDVTDSPFTVEWTDDAAPARALRYYRVIVRRGSSGVFTNPTFVSAHVL